MKGETDRTQQPPGRASLPKGGCLPYLEAGLCLLKLRLAGRANRLRGEGEDVHDAFQAAFLPHKTPGTTELHARAGFVASQGAAPAAAAPWLLSGQVELRTDTQVARPQLLP